MNDWNQNNSRKTHPRGTSHHSGHSNHSGSPHQRSNRGGDHKGRSGNRLKNNSDVYILDILQHGGVDHSGHSWHPVSQIISVPTLQFYEVMLNKSMMGDIHIEMQTKFEERPDALFQRVNKHLKWEDLTPASQTSLESVIKDYVKKNEDYFVKFINNLGPITIKKHYLELFPGVGKKLMNEIIQVRNLKSFENYQDIKTRVPGFRVIEMITKRIIIELSTIDEKHYLFVKKQTFHSSEDRRTDHSTSFRERREGGYPSSSRNRL